MQAAPSRICFVIKMFLLAVAFVPYANNANALSTGADITDIKIYDEGAISDSAKSLAIDVTKDTCTNGSTSTPEKFYDTLLGITVRNRSISAIRFNRFSFIVANYDGAGHSFKSKKFYPSSGFEIKPGATSDVLVLFLHAFGTQKLFAGSSSAALDSVSFQTVTVKLEGALSSGRKISVSARTTMSLRDVDRCSSN